MVEQVAVRAAKGHPWWCGLPEARIAESGAGPRGTGRGGSMADRVSEEKQRAYFERTKKGVLLWLADQGGSAEMREMHDYSASKFLVAHQGFSKLMEACVDEGLVEFDRGTVSLTDAGRTLAAS
jgi:predicted methyltransferase